MSEPTHPFTVTKAAMRPASSEEQCFYCQQPIGALHKSDCVLIKRSVRVRVEFEYDIEVPADWDAAMIEFHRNDSSWCASNIITELEQAEKQNGNCLCANARTTVLRRDNNPYLDE